MAMESDSVRWDELEGFFLRTSAVREVKNILQELEGKQLTSAEVESVIQNVIEALKGKYATNNLWIIENKILPNVKKARSRAVLEYIVKQLKEVGDGVPEDRFGFIIREVEPSEEEQEEILRSSQRIEGVIGRVAIVKAPSTTPYSFPFWVEEDARVKLEPGDFLVVDMSEGEGKRLALGVVEEIESTSDIPDVNTHYYLWGFGSPREEMPTEITTIRKGVANVVYRSDQENDPFRINYPVKRADSETLEHVFSELVRPNNRVLLGFARSGDGDFVPVFGDFTYIYGYEGGHVNITGKSGVAGKTSYALFLIASSLSYSMMNNAGLAFIAFNVKERDLLDVKNIRFQNMNNVLSTLEEKSEPELKKSYAMWEKCASLQIDPVNIFRNATVFTPARAPSESGAIQYSYGLQDLLSRGINAFLSLFEREDINDQFESLALSIQDEFGGRDISFRDLINELRSRLSRTSRNQPVTVGGIPHFDSTIKKMLTRLNKIVSSARAVEVDNPHGNPIQIEDLRPDDLWIIDINVLPDHEQRMVFFSILSDLKLFLENRKMENERVVRGGETIDISRFPKRVGVFVDELNKFAPKSGSSGSAIKQFIVDIAARGRSIGLSLVGAEQFASQIDEEVLGNASTYLIGKSEAFEISASFYRRLPEGLKKRVPFLKKGELIVVHEVHNTPIVLHFPIPIHRI